MDPLTALSVAATVVQFVDFTTKLLSTANEIRKDGTSVDAKHLKRSSGDLAALSKGLRNRPGGNAAMSAEERGVDDIALDCATTADTLVKILNTLADDSERGKSWKSVRAALKTAWRKDEIEMLTARLDNYRDQLNLRLINLLNAKIDRLFTDSSNRLQRIVEAVTFTHELLENRFSSKREQAVSALLTLSDGTTRSLASQPSTLADSDGLLQQQDIQRVITFRDGSYSGRPDHANISTKDFDPLAFHVLTSLHHRMVHVRHETVAESAKGTFNWMLEEQADQQPWGDFSKWLQEDGDCYWITGKPGSGKSTLMKYILSDQRMMEHLRAWAGSKPLATASFFFWAQGVKLQKTQEGLLRGLLHDLLKQFPFLIPEVFPDIWIEMTKSTSGRAAVQPTLEELQIAFKRLVHMTARRFKVCLFIDGMDEYEGDHESLCKFLLGLSRSSANFKITVSSRPWNVFQGMFARQPNLRLQDLTRSDIRLFASDSLKRCDGVEELEERYPGTTNELVESICEKASGVFLWVFLAVRALRESIVNAAHVTHLKQKIDELPPDLEKMYSKIFNSLSDEDQVSAARMILMVLLAASIVDRPISLLQMAFAEEFTLKKAIQAPLQAMPTTQLRALCEQTNRRLRARTLGLLEVAGWDNSDRTGRPSLSVTFLHRTVGDFFKTSDMWDLINNVRQEPFDIETRLVASFLYEMKLMPFRKDITLDSDEVFQSAVQILTCASHLEVQTCQPCTLLLDELAKVIKRHLGKASKISPDGTGSWETIDFPDVYYLLIYILPAKRSFYVPDTPSFLHLAVRMDCVLYVVDKVRKLDNLKDKASMLYEMSQRFFQLIVYATRVEYRLFDHYLTAVSSLFQQGVDLNYVRTKSWLTLVQLTFRELAKSSNRLPMDMTYFTKLLELLSLFIREGADMNARVSLSSGESMSVVSALRSCEETSKQLAQTQHKKTEVEAGWRILWELVEKVTDNGAKEPRADTVSSRPGWLKRRVQNLQARWIGAPSTR